MILELYVADVVGDHKNKMYAMHMKIRKIGKYIVTNEAQYHYVVGAIVTFVAILIAFIVAFKCFRQIALCCFYDNKHIYVYELYV